MNVHTLTSGGAHVCTHVHSCMSLYILCAPQRKEYNVSRVPEEIGETQTMSEFKHAIVPVATHAAHYEIAPADIGNIK